MSCHGNNSFIAADVFPVELLACQVSTVCAANRPFYSCVLSYLAMNASKAGVDLALIQTSLLFSCKLTVGSCFSVHCRVMEHAGSLESTKEA